MEKSDPTKKQKKHVYHDYELTQMKLDIFYTLAFRYRVLIHWLTGLVTHTYITHLYYYTL